ncbi:MAG TPA: VWA domain-containing protein [Spirochaetota bacterium]|nr:VWA domain-containing protein [Spirochaetota bacterium]HQO39255.1 VWA domain-containing protein [Spirochaetota bacterium]
MITFSNAQYAIYIIPAGVIPLLFFLLYSYMRRRIVRAVTGAHYKKVLFVSGSYTMLFVKEVLVVLAVVSLIVAMLGPGWGEESTERRSEGTDLLIALDVSRSMLASDTDSTRLERAKRAVRLIAGFLDGDRIGLIVFSGEAFLMCPLTTDTGALMMFLDSAGPETVTLEGTDMGRMFDEVLRVFEKKRLTSRVLVVITDGEDNEGGAVDGADKLKDAGIAVYALGVGRDSAGLIPRGKDVNDYYRDSRGEPVRTKADPDLLRRLAADTGGRYIDITNSFSGLDSVIGAVNEQDEKSTGARKVKQKIDRSWIFLLAAVIFMIAEMVIPSTVRRYAKNG